MKKETFDTWVIIRKGERIVEKTYAKAKTKNQLRALAINYMVNHDMDTKTSFHVEYETKGRAE